MGLIKAMAQSAMSYIGDMWEDYIYCDAMDSEVLVQKGYRRASAGAADGASDNVITQGSHIAVNDGQALIVVENGRIIDFSAEPGGYEYCSDTEPSMFCGDFGDALSISFEEIKKRFSYGGIAGKDQRAYFVNTKEIPALRFGFGNVTYRDSEFDLTITLQGFGSYSLRVADPLALYTNISGNVTDSYRVESIEPQLKAELAAVLLPALGELGQAGVRYDQIILHTDELADIIRRQTAEKWKDTRGIELVSIAFASIAPDDESADKIRQMQESRAYSSDKAMLGARVGAAQANAMEAAAENTAGAVNGFMGMNMTASSGGVNVNELMSDASGAGGNADAAGQTGAQTAADTSEKWICPDCGMENYMDFCPKCGAKRPEKKKCPSCGFELPKEYEEFAFCPKCGGKI